MALMVKKSTGIFIEKLMKEEKNLKITISIVAESEVLLSKDKPLNRNKKPNIVVCEPSSAHNLNKDLQHLVIILLFYFLMVII